MAEKYANFDSPATDKAPIFPDIKFRSWSFRASEVGLGVLLVVTLVICVALAGVLASKGSGYSDKDLVAAKQTARIEALKDCDPLRGYCVSESCLKSSSYVVLGMNKTVNPCDNFYQYACGNWAGRHPVDSDYYQRDVFSNIYNENEDKIRKMVESKLSRDDEWSSERKVKHFFQGCTDTYSKDRLGGTPIIKKLADMGGWYVLGTFNSATWDLTSILKKIRVDLWTEVLFSFSVGSDWNTPQNNVIKVRTLYFIKGTSI